MSSNPSSANATPSKDNSQTATLPQYSVPAQQIPQTKYSQLQAVIDELGKDIRPTYAGNRASGERLKRNIIHARILVRECLIETEKAGRL